MVPEPGLVGKQQHKGSKDNDDIPRSAPWAKAALKATIKKDGKGHEVADAVLKTVEEEVLDGENPDPFHRGGYRLPLSEMLTSRTEASVATMGAAHMCVSTSPRAGTSDRIAESAPVGSAREDSVSEGSPAGLATGGEGAQASR